MTVKQVPAADFEGKRFGGKEGRNHWDWQLMWKEGDVLPKTSVSNCCCYWNARHSCESSKVLMRFWQQEMVAVMWLFT